MHKKMLLIGMFFADVFLFHITFSEFVDLDLSWYAFITIDLTT